MTNLPAHLLIGPINTHPKKDIIYSFSFPFKILALLYVLNHYTVPVIRPVLPLCGHMIRIVKNREKKLLTFKCNIAKLSSRNNIR